LQQLDFWTKFKEYAQSKKSGIHFGHSPRPQHWYNVSIGSSDAHIALTIDSRKNIIGCEIYIDKSKELFKYLQERKDEIESEIGDDTEWVDAHVASRVVVKKAVGSVFASSEAQHHFEWLHEKTVLFQKVFGKYLKAYKKAPVS
jgi:hypothetical protein